MEKRLKILLATDYSEVALNAERYAIRLAQSLHANITFLHVFNITYELSAKPEEFAKSAEELYQYELKHMDQHCESLLSAMGIREGELIYEQIIREGDNIGKQIMHEARECNADLIAIGTHGVSGFQKLFFGNHAWEVTKRSNTTVLAIPKDAAFKEIKNIVYGTDYRKSEIPGLNFLVHFAEMLHAHVTMLHIKDHLSPEPDELEAPEKFKYEMVYNILFPEFEMRKILGKNIVESIHQFCNENKTDLLVMCPEKPSLFETIFSSGASVGREAIFQTHIPLMAIPDSYTPRPHTQELSEVQRRASL